ncbi:MAG TPA: DUF1269 domain-containing protein [Solirubrobacteraceae bacterium]
MSLDLALVSFKGQATAASVFGTLRDRVGSAVWTSEVAIVEHHGHDRMSVRGTFAGRYVDVEESDHVSERGAGEGGLTGAVVGAVFGPPGIASGLVLGGIIGAEAHKPSELEPEPEVLIDELRQAIPSGHSAIALLAEPTHVDALLSALDGSDHADVLRRALTAEQASALITSIAADPPASHGPTETGDSASGV